LCRWSRHGANTIHAYMVNAGHQCAWCPMFEPSHATRLPILTLLALVLVPSAADAKGGHSHGRGHGAGPTGFQSTSQPVKGDPPALSTTKGGTIPASSLKAITTVPTPSTAPVPSPASVIGAPEPQLGVHCATVVAPHSSHSFIDNRGQRRKFGREFTGRWRREFAGLPRVLGSRDAHEQS
jgi:hypothetical protein